MSFSVASSTLEYLPQPTAARMAAPNAGPSSELILSTLTLSTLATIWHHKGLFAPPPLILVLSILTPKDLAISYESRRANATPSKTA